MQKPGLYISSFLKKSGHEKWLLFRVFLLLFWVRFLLLILPFKHFSSLLGKQTKNHDDTSPAIDENYVDMVSRYIKTFSYIVPWDSKCLAQAAAGKILMRKKGFPATVYFGVKKGTENEKIEAHAWLRVGPKIVLGGEIADQFMVVNMFS